MAEALLLAERGGLDPAARDRFAMAGLSHLLAISGLHVGLVAGSLLLVGRLLGLSATAAALAAAAVTLGYVLFLGAPPAATRAALQVGLLLGSRLMQRPADPLALVAAAGLVLLVRDPLALLDPGFQLSFSGVLGLALLAPRMRRARPAGGAVRRAVRDALVVNTAATLATAPIAALHFGRFAGIGILANLVAVPLVSLAVPSLALAFLGSLVAWPVGAFLAGAPVPLLDALDLVARVAAAVPHGSVIVSRDVLWSWLLALGCALGMLSLLPAAAGAAGRRRARRWAAGGAAAAIFIAWPVLARGVGGERLEIHAIDVGQGDAIAIRSPAGRWALVDAGPRTLRRDAGRAEVVPFLLRHGVRRLELLVLTHPDADHIGGAAAILSMLRVGVVLDPGRAEGKPLYLEAIQAAGEDGSRWRAARAGRELELDGAVIRVLYPPAEPLDATAEANAVSVVLALEYGEFRALLLGDAPMEVEERLVETEGERLRADVLKVGHHGSATSSGAALLRAASPRLAVIPVGRGNRYGHPEADVLERLDAAGARILRTDRDGTISIRVRPNGEWTVETQR